MKLSVVENENPHYSESINDLMNMMKEGRIKGFVLSAITEDGYVYTDWVKSDGITMTELIGCNEVLKQELIDKMRG